MPTTNDPASAADSHDRAQLVLGIDGGGTKTVAWLASCANSAQPTTIGRGDAGPSNPQTVGPQAAQQNIQAAVEHAFADAQRAPAKVAAACLALAGAGREPIRQEMLRRAQELSLARQVQVVHDGQAVLAIGTQDGTGIAVICGTGSFAYGETVSGTTARSGGWGYLFGDEGSGYAIGCAALRAVACATDGRGPTTILTTALLAQLQLTDPSQLIPAVYGDASTRCTIASLTPLVFQAAQNGDDVALQICRDAATELAQLVQSVSRRLDLPQGQYDLAMGGGVLAHHPTWAESMARSLGTMHWSPRSFSIVRHPVAGAVALANRSRCG